MLSVKIAGTIKGLFAKALKEIYVFQVYSQKVMNRKKKPYRRIRGVKK